MALNKDILGLALYNRRSAFDNRTIEDLLDEYVTIEAVRLAIAKADADEIINHFKAAGVVTVNPLGLTAAATPVTGIATGTIS